MKHKIVIQVLTIATQDEVIAKIKDIGGQFINVDVHLTDPTKYIIECESAAFLCWVCNVLGRFDININVEEDIY